MIKTLSFFGLISCFFCISCTTTADSSLETVSKVELKKYVGTWYEIARLPQFFQKNCTKSQATYSLRSDGDIKVINQCLHAETGEVRKAEGRAWVTNPPANSKLKVQFFLARWRLPFLSGNYWIAELAEDYSYAVIGDPSLEYFWILSRDESMNCQLYDEIIHRFEGKGYDLRDIVIDRPCRH